MAISEFNILDVESIGVRFKCENCGNKIEKLDLIWHGPNFDVENPNDSAISTENYFECDNCGNHYCIEIIAALGTSELRLSTTDDDYEIELIIERYQEDFDALVDEMIDSIISSRTESHLFYEIEEIKKLLKLDLDDKLYAIILKQSFVHAITILESFLSEILIKNVLEDQKTFELFVYTYKPFKKEIFNLANIHEKYRELNNIVKRELLKIMYHDLPKIKNIYREVLKFELGEIGELTKIVERRHDLVHRNGKTKEGTMIELSREEVENVISKIEVFMVEADGYIKAIRTQNAHTFIQDLPF